MRLLTALAAVPAAAESGQSWTQPPSTFVLGALISGLVSGAVVVFLIRRSAGRRRAHEVTLADFWWTNAAGKEVTDEDPAGPSLDYRTAVDVQVTGRRLEGSRRLTNLTLNERPQLWAVWRWRGWCRRSALDLVGPRMEELWNEGLELGDTDSGIMRLEVVQDGRRGRYELGGRWRIVPWNGARRGIPKALKHITRDQPPG